MTSSRARRRRTTPPTRSAGSRCSRRAPCTCPPGAPAVTTREGLEETAAAGFGSWTADVRIAPAEIVVHGDWAFARSDVSGTVTSPEDGEAFPVDVKQIAIYHRQPDGSWKIARLITNSNS